MNKLGSEQCLHQTRNRLWRLCFSWQSVYIVCAAPHALWHVYSMRTSSCVRFHWWHGFALLWCTMQPPQTWPGWNYASINTSPGSKFLIRDIIHLCIMTHAAWQSHKDTFHAVNVWKTKRVFFFFYLHPQIYLLCLFVVQKRLFQAVLSPFSHWPTFTWKWKILMLKNKTIWY